jgi:SMC interacting uncharacterized protein involved in chromosome segregation
MQRKEDYVSDERKFVRLIEQLEAHESALAEKVAARQTECEEKEAELSSVVAELEGVHHTLAEQELSPSDVANIQEQKRFLKNDYADLSARREEMQAVAWEGDRAVAKAVAQLEAGVTEYHDAAAGVELLPPNPRNANGLNFELALDVASVTGGSDLTRSSFLSSSSASLGRATARSIATVDGLLGGEGVTVLRSGLRELKSRCIREALETRTSQLQLKDRVEQGLESAEEHARVRAELSKQARTLEVALAKEKEDMALELAKGEEEMTELETMIADGREFKDSMVALAREVSASALGRLARESRKKQRVMEKEREAIVKKVVSATTVLVNHKEFVAERLRGVNARWSATIMHHDTHA